MQCDPEKMALAEFTFDTDDVEDSKAKVDKLMCIVNQTFTDNYYNVPYKIVSIKKGSVIITITSSLLLILLAAKVAKSVCHTVCKIQVEIAASKKLLDTIENTKTHGTMLNVLKKYSDYEKNFEKDDLGLNNLTNYIIQLTK